MVSFLRMAKGFASQREFIPLLYDTLFGLILFFSLDSFLEIKDPAHFVFYLFTTFIVIHWWLMFKAAEDTFDPGVRDTAVHVVANITYIVLLEFMILMAKEFALHKAVMFLLAVLVLDTVWAVAVLVAGKWRRGAPDRVAGMSHDLLAIVRTDAFLVVGLAALLACSSWLATAWETVVFVALYGVFIYMTFRAKIVDIRPW